MSFETVNYELKDGVAVITLNRPDALNALSQQLTRDLRAAVDKVTEDKARAVVLTGAGRAFCAGGDLKEMQEIGEREGKVEAFLDAQNVRKRLASTNEAARYTDVFRWYILEVWMQQMFGAP